MGRKKKLEKGIESLEKQYRIHQEKFDLTNDEYAKKYWKKEMQKFEGEIERKKRQMERKKGK